MAQYDLSSLTVLVVEDNAFIRRTLVNILFALKIRRVTQAANGAEAVEFLQLVAKDPQKANVLKLDIVFSDRYMDPMDGSSLLRWVRRNEASPDRFVPFVMISGAADGEMVREARDFGVNEFLVKPFSAKSVADRVLAVIDNPRPFIYTHDYFGPDRRRRDAVFQGRDRRVIAKSEIEVLYSGKAPRALGATSKVWVFNLPNRLRERLSGGAPAGEAGQVDLALIQQAEKQLLSLESEYASSVLEFVKNLQELCDKALADPAQAAGYFRSINQIAHELRGQGSTFGYPLITTFGKSLYEQTKLESNAEITQSLLDLVKAHSDAVQIVIREKIKGMGGKVGVEIVKMLEKAKDKFAQRAAAKKT